MLRSPARRLYFTASNMASSADALQESDLKFDLKGCALSAAIGRIVIVQYDNLPGCKYPAKVRAVNADGLSVQFVMGEDKVGKRRRYATGAPDEVNDEDEWMWEEVAETFEQQLVRLAKEARATLAKLQAAPSEGMEELQHAQEQVDAFDAQLQRVADARKELEQFDTSPRTPDEAAHREKRRVRLHKSLMQFMRPRQHWPDYEQSANARRNAKRLHADDEGYAESSKARSSAKRLHAGDEGYAESSTARSNRRQSAELEAARLQRDAKARASRGDDLPDDTYVAEVEAEALRCFEDAAGHTGCKDRSLLRTSIEESSHGQLREHWL